MNANIWKEGNEMTLVSSQNSFVVRKTIARKFKNYSAILSQTLLPSFSFCTRILKAVWVITILSVVIFRGSNTMASAITEDRPCSFVAIEMSARKYYLYLGSSNILLHFTVSFLSTFCETMFRCTQIMETYEFFLMVILNTCTKTWNSKSISHYKNNFMSIFTLVDVEK